MNETRCRKGKDDAREGRTGVSLSATERQGDGKHRLYSGGIRKASFLMPA